MLLQSKKLKKDLVVLKINSTFAAASLMRVAIKTGLRATNYGLNKKI